MAALDALPNELLALVANHLDRPKDVVHLALTCSSLNGFVKLDGWKAFQRGRFGLLGLDGDARNAVHGLTTLYRNWNRRAFTARYVEPNMPVTSLNSGHRKIWRAPQSQTMGYRPSVDSYEEINGAWADRREVLAWCAGTNVVMRVKKTASNPTRGWEEMNNDPESPFEHGLFSHPSAWYTYKVPESKEGQDDIGPVKLLRPHQKDPGYENIVFGTAAGRLSMLSAGVEERAAQEQLYDTERRFVGSISVSSATEPLMAAALGDAALALYPVIRHHFSETPIQPISQARPIMPRGRIWTCSFISNSKVAIGVGQSHEPIQVYEITPDGLLSTPLRKFSFAASENWNGHPSVRRNTSVYPIVPVSSESQGGSEANNVFLTGGYDGIIMLHDMRSPRAYETLFWDVTNDSAIYSLACQGVERFVAGSSMHSMLKVFDLRLSGAHAYHTIPIPAKPRTKRQDYAYNTIVDSQDSPYVGNVTSRISGGWNVYLTPRNPSQPNRNRPVSRPRSRNEDSPVYSLSIPSSTSPNLYAGLVDTVQNLNFVSVLDPHPDPLISQSITRFADSSIDVKSSYNPFDDVLNLGMYEQGNEEGVDMQLLVQEDVSSGLAENRARKDFARRRGLDERWKDPSEDGKIWVRGQVPQGNARRGGMRGRGRGRTRGAR